MSGLKLYLFPRYVAKGNYSRIGIARVKFNKNGDPQSVERLDLPDILPPEGVADPPKDKV